MGVAPVTEETADQPDIPAGNGRRAAIVGTGFMGRVHARAVRAGGGRVVGIVGSSLERAESARPEIGADQAFGDLRDLVESVDVDVVHVCTPNHLHEPVVHAALAAGKHVVCEKPLAVDGATAERLADAARSADRIATVPFVYRFHPVVREARERVRRGEIGTISLVHGSYLQDWMLHPSDDNWRVDPEFGGPTRAFGDIGSHWCDLLEFVTGDRIVGLSARTSTVNGRRGESQQRDVTTEDVVTMQFATASGAPGSVVISQVSAGRKNRLLLEVSGSQGTLSFDQENPEVLWWGGRERSSLVVRDPDTLSDAAARYAHIPAGHPQGYQDCFNSFVADTAAAVRGDTPDGLPTFDDGLRAARLADAVVASAREQSWVEVAR
ncbi:putative dehydrogenase [Haloactinopolyspora alba]|uniref:Putative dehydrogenase n=1 Tax=Haloactinopolyspora alba TaxID=648780 RepID=A0A2P8EC17_9ACTN|nr:Gfo/Idh/MocA family oxidoreductase [Haloactinopolyspora alba]PSL06977.1 putative dehydrogenase [Haloactinopolyspora alba]